MVKILSKINALLKSADAKTKRRLFFSNTASKIHPTFRFGLNNYADISPTAVFHIAENVYINESNFLSVKKGATLTIGKNTYITRATIACLERITIGENCILGEGLKIFDHNHRYTTEPFVVSKTEFNTSPITIGNNVWTGANCIILKGVTIGDNVILGSGCVIHKDVPSNTVIMNKQEHIIRPLPENSYHTNPAKN